MSCYDVHYLVGVAWWKNVFSILFIFSTDKIIQSNFSFLSWCRFSLFILLIWFMKLHIAPLGDAASPYYLHDPQLQYDIYIEREHILDLDSKYHSFFLLFVGNQLCIDLFVRVLTTVHGLSMDLWNIFHQIESTILSVQPYCVWNKCYDNNKFIYWSKWRILYLVL